MASIKLLPLATLLLVTLLGGASSLAAAAATATTPAPPFAAGSFDAAATCRNLAEHPRLCKHLVVAYKPASPDQLLEAAINESIGRARRAKKAYERLLKSGGQQEEEEYSMPLQRCSSAFERVAETLGESLRRIRDGRRKSGFRLIFEAKNLLVFCYDSFDPGHEYNGLMDFPGKRTFTNLKNLVANAYSLACGSGTVDCTNF